MKTFSIRPFQEDVRQQLDTTRDIIEVMESLSQLKKTFAQQTDEGSQQALLQIDSASQRLAAISEDLMNNADKTSSFIREIAFK